MSMADTDGDGRVSRDEHARHAEKMFDMMDKNKDGFIDKDEAAAMRKKHAQGHGQSRPYGSEGQGPGYGEAYGTRWGDRQLQHMKPMGEEEWGSAATVDMSVETGRSLLAVSSHLGRPRAGAAHGLQFPNGLHVKSQQR